MLPWVQISQRVASSLYHLFFIEDHIVEIGVQIMHVIIFVVIFQICQVIYMGCLRGAGDTLYTAVASMISVTFIRTIISYFCGYVLGWGIIGIWMGVLGDQVSRFIFALILFRIGWWATIYCQQILLGMLPSSAHFR